MDIETTILAHKDVETIDTQFIQTTLFRQKLRVISIVIFIIMITCSTILFIGVLGLWLSWPPQINLLTNNFQSFFGFVTSQILVIMGSWGGILTLRQNEGIWMDAMHGDAVVMMLGTGILFNILFPTSALLPLEIDSRKRIQKIPVLDCPELLRTTDSSTDIYVECKNAGQVELCLYCMYSVVILEILSLVPYAYIRCINDPEFQPLDFDLSTGNDEDDDEDGNEVTTVARMPGDVVTMLPVTTAISTRNKRTNPNYWTSESTMGTRLYEPPLETSRSAPMRADLFAPTK